MDKIDQRLPRRYGDYVLLRRIARGGMGEIFLAELQGAGGFRRDVIVKQLLSQYSANAEFINMLFDEARIAARLMHPNIAQVIHCGEHAGAAYLVLEYVHGQSLRRLLRRLSERGEELTFEESMYILIGVLGALEYAHSKTDDEERPMHIIHRDVTPENVLLSYSGEVKLTDFGVARATGRTENTRTGIIKGKLAYLAPEQVRGLNLDHRVDQYMLGLTVCEVLSGARVFDANTDAKIINQVLDGAAYRVSRRPEIIDRLGPAYDMVMRSLQYSPDERFPSCAEMAEEAASLTTPGALAHGRQLLSDRMLELFAEERAEERSELATARSQIEQMGTTVTETEPAAPREVTRTTVDIPFAPPESPLPWMMRGGAVVAVMFLGAVIYITHMDLSPQRAPERVTVFTPIPPPAPPVTAVAPPPPPPAAPPKPVIASAQPSPAVPAPPPAPAPADDPPEAAPAPPAAHPHPTHHTEARPAAPPHRHVAARPPPEQTGALDVACLPWCDISLNGQSLHRTSPLRNYKVVVGEYDVKVVNPPTGQSEQRHVTVHPGEHMQMQFRLAGPESH